MPASTNKPAPAAGAAPSEKPLQNKRRTEVLLVGLGDETLIEVGPALGDEYRTFSADTAAEVAGVDAKSWIGLYDATVRSEARSEFAKLEQQYARHPWIVLCADEAQGDWQPAVSRGSACAVIALGEISRDSINAALVKAKQRLLAAPMAAAPSAPTGSPNLVPWIVGAVVVAMAGAGGWWFAHRHSDTPAAISGVNPGTQSPGSRAGLPATAVDTASQALPAASVEDLLSKARIAFRNPTTQLPKADAPLQGSSALELYGAVLEQQPNNPEALEGVRRLQSVARLRVQNALASGDIETAARLLAVLQHSDIAPEELRALNAAVTAARPRQLASQARSAMAAGNLQGARQYIDQLVALAGERSPVPELRKELDARTLTAALATDAQQVRAAIAAGALLEPAADNARTRVLAMLNLSRTNALTVAAERDLLTALLRRGRTAIGHEDFDGAQQLLTSAQDFGDSADLADARATLSAAISAKRLAADASAAAAKALATAPVADAKAAVAHIIAPRPMQGLQLEFPRAAVLQKLQGYVLVEFTLNPNGSTSAPTVIESSPPGVFDISALTAIRHATFSTHDLADPRKPQRARFRIAYSLSGSAVSNTKAAVDSATPDIANDGSSAALRIISAQPTQPLQVNYPRAAFQRHERGYVVVEFTLNPDGSPDSLTVGDAQPANVFDHEALAAVQGAKFATKDLTDPTKAQRARIKIIFEPSE